MWEVILILVIALIFLGPRQLAETAQVIGRMYRELQKLMWDVRNSVDLDSLTSTDSHPYEPPPKNRDAGQQIAGKGDLVPPPGEKTGPDFYGELLEKAAEEEEKEKTLDAVEAQGRKQEEIDKKTEPKEGDSHDAKAGA
jgi:sec-independent protein translocase protein TatB